MVAKGETDAIYKLPEKSRVALEEHQGLIACAERQGIRLQRYGWMGKHALIGVIGETYVVVTFANNSLVKTMGDGGEVYIHFRGG